jgi:hypothetical protein
VSFLHECFLSIVPDIFSLSFQLEDGVYNNKTVQKMITSHVVHETRKPLAFLKDQKSSDGGGKNYWAESVQNSFVVQY